LNCRCRWHDPSSSRLDPGRQLAGILGSLQLDHLGFAFDLCCSSVVAEIMRDRAKAVQYDLADDLLVLFCVHRAAITRQAANSASADPAPQ
jgi:hypothetical protein